MNANKESSQATDQKKLILRRPPRFMDAIISWSGAPRSLVSAYVKKGTIAADLGCGWGAYTFAMADLAGDTGRIYAVDLGENCIRAIQKKAAKKGYKNIEAHASSAAEVSFIKDRSLDFVLANGLLCSMAGDRDKAVAEIKRILNPTGRAYISLGFPPPLGLVDQAEWESIMRGFKIVGGGSFKELWALVSVKN